MEIDSMTQTELKKLSRLVHLPGLPLHAFSCRLQDILLVTLTSGGGGAYPFSLVPRWADHDIIPACVPFGTSFFVCI